MFDPNKLIKRYKETQDAAFVAKEFNVHKSTVYRWIKKSRTLTKGYLKHTGLKRESTKPKRTKKCTLSSEERIAIEELRIRYGWCAQRITGYLQRKGTLKEERGFSTVYRFLKRKGMINEKKKHRRPRFQDTKHMHLKNAKTIGKLQMDVKYVTPELSGLTHTVFKFAVIDIFSRYKQALIFPVLDMQHAIMALESILRTLPFEADFIQTDNGLEFQSKFIGFCKKQGLKHHFIHKRSPNENAVIERSFRTDEEEFYFRLKERPKDLFELNYLYQEYLTEYNTIRPHLGINLQTPQEVVANVLTQ